MVGKYSKVALKKITVNFEADNSVTVIHFECTVGIYKLSSNDTSSTKRSTCIYSIFITNG